ncbi:MAG: hypothetical protein HWE07_10545 [Cytophagia bacterium]|nr:hypothetical protein [Cytophagia bacterium]
MEVSAWVWEAVFQIKQTKNAKLVLAVINQSPKSSGKKSPFLYRLYRWVDRKLFLKHPDAFSKKNLHSIPGWNLPELTIQPIQKTYSDYFNTDTLSQIRAHNPDVLIRFGFRILRGEILNLAPLGVWSFHHGDPQAYRGGPPCFWEVMKQEEVTGVVLQRLNEKLDEGAVLYRSWVQTDPLSVQRNANKVFWTSSYFIARVLNQIQVLGLETWKEGVDKSQIQPKQPVPLLKPPTWPQMSLDWLRLIARNVLRKIKEGQQKPYWSLTVATSFLDELIPNQSLKFKNIEPPKGSLSKGSFWADPFPVEFKGETWVFYEEFDYPSQKGKIGVGLWDGETLVENQVILEESWHLSYPFIWKEGSDFYLIPESGESGRLWMYKVIDFPFRWEKVVVFFEGEAYDPTILKKNNRYWLFVNQRAHEGGSPFVELFAYYSDSLEKPEWKPHALNPIVSDVRSSRPAGNFFQHEGKWYRPAQDSGKRYGYQIKIQELIELTPESFEEKTVQILSPDEHSGVLGMHTLNFSNLWAFSDAYSRR